jgi:hypothetical protein
MGNIAQTPNLARHYPTYKPTPTHIQSRLFLQSATTTDADDDDATIIISNCSHTHEPLPETSFHTSQIAIASDQAIADAGATGHFVLPGAPVTDIRTATNPLVINLPDGEKITSTHTCRLNLPWLPERARDAHIVPGLAHTSLVSIKILCDAGCKVTYDDTACNVYYADKLVWRGH